jgi:rhodanese-related sulfurtransferase
MTIRERTAVEVHAEVTRYRVIDVREPDEFYGALGTIAGAELIPLATVAEHAARLTGAQPLLLVCRSGRRSVNACETLKGLGVEDVTNLAGGMLAWEEAGLPVERPVRSDPVPGPDPSDSSDPSDPSNDCAS